MVHVKYNWKHTNVLCHVEITYEQVCGQWSHNKACERLLLLVANVAEPSEIVGVH